MELPGADPSPMRRQDEQGPSVVADLFGLVSDHLDTPPPLETSGDERRLLLAELRGLIERDEYNVDPEAVAEAIIQESGRSPVIDWID